ncbi:ricin B lectin domain-containing protein [Chlamydoabsidia padenii]|nr:ricin B lectin domain-containing protein [Chlamydoabsidia padenii]
MSFPTGWFYIESQCEHNMVLDVALDSLKQAAKVIVWPRKRGNESNNQLWMYDKGYIINKNSGLVLDIQGGIIESDKQIIQYKRKLTENAQNQRWYYREDGLIYPQVDPNLVLDIRGNWTKPGTVVLLYERKFTENYNQRWNLVPLDGSSTDATSSHQPDLDPSYRKESIDSDSYAL